MEKLNNNENEILLKALLIANERLGTGYKEKEIKDRKTLENTSMSLTDCANLLGIKFADFKSYLLEHHYIFLTKYVKKIRCYTEYSTNKGNGLFYLKIDYDRNDGRELIQTKVTLKGFEYFKKKFEEEGVI